jgi:threonine dehydrogenase-like Zn-dependent dehydrogenase
MKAVAVFPGKPGSVHLADLPGPSLSDVPDGRGVLVRILRVGLDGTDREINAAEYGTAPTAPTSSSSAMRASAWWRRSGRRSPR